MTGREELNETRRKYVMKLAEKYPIINDFYRWMKVSGLEELTCWHYCRYAVRFLEETGVDYKTATTNDVVQFLYSHKKGDKPQSALTVLWHGLSKFYTFLESTGEVEKNIVKGISRPKPKSPEDVKRTFLTPEECQKLLWEISYDNRHDPYKREREGAIYRIFINTGIRLSALVNLNYEDYDPEEFTLTVTDKGNKTTVYPINVNTCVYIDEYLEQRKERQGRDPQPDEPLFLSDTGKRINATTVSKNLKTYAHGIGRDDISPHKLRASFATNLYNETKDIRFVQEAMNHAMVTTTQLYIQPEVNTHEKASEIMDHLLKGARG
jgi:integrase/recombinase XerD